MNVPPTPTRIDKLELENFRCFSKLVVDFHQRLTVLVAPNGGGKTALLDAVCYGWQYFLQGIELEQSAKTIRDVDVRKVLRDGVMAPIKPVSLAGETHVGGASVHWSVDKGRTAKVNTSSRGAEAMRNAGQSLRLASQNYAEGKEAHPPILPVIGYYGTGRLWAKQNLTQTRRKRIKADSSPTSGYDQCLSPSSHFTLFEVWFERYSREAQKENSGEDASAHKPAEKLQAVIQAVDAILKPVNWHSLSFDFVEEAVTAKHPVNGILPVSMLSDGIQIILGLVGDIAHRCVRLNPHLGANAARLTSGIILIDEVDMHLHPAWQQQVLASLTEAFPLIQFIVTTHSPQVLSTVKRENIRMLTQDLDGSWSASLPDDEVKGMESSTALSDVMGVDPIPPVPEAEWLRDYTAHIESGTNESEEGKHLLAKLVGFYGKNHSIILDCDRLIRFQSFKRRKS